MDEKVIEALMGSIAKWQAIVDGTGVDRGADNNPLCHIFHGAFRTDGIEECDGCPVKEVTKQDGCQGTPYQDYWRAKQKHLVAKFLGAENTPQAQNVLAEAHQHAQRYLDFVKGLLPKGTVN